MSVLQLPSDALALLNSFLPLERVGGLGCTCKQLAQTFRDENFWHLLYLMKWPVAAFSDQSWAARFRSRRRWCIPGEMKEVDFHTTNISYDKKSILIHDDIIAIFFSNDFSVSIYNQHSGSLLSLVLLQYLEGFKDSGINVHGLCQQLEIVTLGECNYLFLFFNLPSHQVSNVIVLRFDADWKNPRWSFSQNAIRFRGIHKIGSDIYILEELGGVTPKNPKQPEYDFSDEYKPKNVKLKKFDYKKNYFTTLKVGGVGNESWCMYGTEKFLVFGRHLRILYPLEAEATLLLGSDGEPYDMNGFQSMCLSGSQLLVVRAIRETGMQPVFELTLFFQQKNSNTYRFASIFRSSEILATGYGLQKVLTQDELTRSLETRVEKMWADTFKNTFMVLYHCQTAMMLYIYNTLPTLSLSRIIPLCYPNFEAMGSGMIVVQSPSGNYEIIDVSSGEILKKVSTSNSILVVGIALQPSSIVFFGGNNGSRIVSFGCTTTAINEERARGHFKEQMDICQVKTPLLQVSQASYQILAQVPLDSSYALKQFVSVIFDLLLQSGSSDYKHARTLLVQLARNTPRFVQAHEFIVVRKNEVVALTDMQSRKYATSFFSCIANWFDDKFKSASKKSPLINLFNAFCTILLDTHLVIVLDGLKKRDDRTTLKQIFQVNHSHITQQCGYDYCRKLPEYVDVRGEIPQVKPCAIQ